MNTRARHESRTGLAQSHCNTNRDAISLYYSNSFKSKVLLFIFLLQYGAGSAGTVLGEEWGRFLEFERKRCKNSCTTFAKRHGGLWNSRWMPQWRIAYFRSMFSCNFCYCCNNNIIRKNFLQTRTIEELEVLPVQPTASFFKHITFQTLYKIPPTHWHNDHIYGHYVIHTAKFHRHIDREMYISRQKHYARYERLLSDILLR